MSKNENLFKAATFLTTLVKSDLRDVYLHEGFTREDMLRELKELKFRAASGFSEEYDEKIESSIDDVLSCLSDERLIYFKDNRYFITPDGEGISHFMTSLSKMYFEESQAIMQFPYRFYPNS